MINQFLYLFSAITMATTKSAAIAFRRRVLNFWFSGNRWPLDGSASPAREAPAHDLDMKRWFGSSKEFDTEVREKFENDMELLMNDKYRYPNDIDEPEHLLACIIALDQFPRNMFRNSARAFAYGYKATQLGCEVINHKADQKLPYLERMFIYLPFEHSECLEDQNLSVNCFKKLFQDADKDSAVGDKLKKLLTMTVGYAEQHQKIIEQFGRFPHRNAVMNRSSTEQEDAYLKAGGERFGQ